MLNRTNHLSTVPHNLLDYSFKNYNYNATQKLLYARLGKRTGIEHIRRSYETAQIFLKNVSPKNKTRWCEKMV